MKTVVYRTAYQLDCFCDLDIVVCMSASLTSNGAPFITGHLDGISYTQDYCGNQIFKYAISYDESQLANPLYDLLSSDITGLICDQCLLAYINYKTGSLS